MKKINILTADTELRESMGARARQTVEERYSLIVNAPVFLDAVSNHNMVGR